MKIKRIIIGIMIGIATLIVWQIFDGILADIFEPISNGAGYKFPKLISAISEDESAKVWLVRAFQLISGFGGMALSIMIIDGNILNKKHNEKKK